MYHKEEIFEVENSNEEVTEFFENLGKTISQYCGFDIKFPVHFEEEKIIYDLDATFTINLTEATSITLEIVNTVKSLLQKSVEYSKLLGGNFLENISKDLTLAFINNEYLQFNSSQQYKIFEHITNLRKVGSKTYEGKPADIGVIYCVDEGSFEEIKSLNFDMHFFEERKSLTQFFSDEKPFLRLIDNQSLAIVVDKNFEVFAMVKKVNEGKSVSQILEAQFNDWTINEMKKQTFNDFAKTIDEHFSKLELSEDAKNGIKEVKGLIEEYKNSLGIIKAPRYVYFSMRNKKMNIFLNRNFIINYENGEWKLKHYGLLIASLMSKLFSNTLNFLYRESVESYKLRLLKMTESITKLSKIVKRLSENESSCIFVIILKNNHKELIDSDEAFEFLIANNFSNNNIKKDFLNVIKSNDKHLNINDSDSYLIEAIASVDGGVIIDKHLNLISFGEIIEVPNEIIYNDTFGTGTRAARFASRLGISIKVSEDGDISLFTEEKLLLKI